ncbi:hypothetical protein D5086_009944 [Populus alba]|uniref:Uncharacterized protein n=1 Tax=Populus alba TaxID=43335 RepID=A0ACC4C8U1_POPAL
MGKRLKLMLRTGWEVLMGSFKGEVGVVGDESSKEVLHGFGVPDLKIRYQLGPVKDYEAFESRDSVVNAIVDSLKDGAVDMVGTPDIRRIQGEIADGLGLKLDAETDRGRASLYERLKK